MSTAREPLWMIRRAERAGRRAAICRALVIVTAVLLFGGVILLSLIARALHAAYGAVPGIFPFLFIAWLLVGILPIPILFLLASVSTADSRKWSRRLAEADVTDHDLHRLVNTPIERGEIIGNVLFTQVSPHTIAMRYTRASRAFALATDAFLATIFCIVPAAIAVLANLPLWLTITFSIISPIVAASIFFPLPTTLRFDDDHPDTNSPTLTVVVARLLPRTVSILTPADAPPLHIIADRMLLLSDPRESPVHLSVAQRSDTIRSIVDLDPAGAPTYPYASLMLARIAAAILRTGPWPVTEQLDALLDAHALPTDDSAHAD